MGLFAKAWNAIKERFQVVKVITNRIEAAYQRWGERSLLGQSLQDAWLDIDPSTRMELQRRHRYWVSNSPVVNRIRSVRIQFSTGVQGLQVVPNSDNEDWNHSRQISWQTWSKAPEINSRLTLAQLCNQWDGAVFDDGEVFIVLHGGMSSAKPNMADPPRLQTFEAHRVKTPTKYAKEEGKSIIDGIRIDSAGMPISYFFSTQYSDREETFEEIPASRVIHIFSPRRPGQPRGTPESTGMNVLHDYDDLRLLEMQVAKMAASIGNVETNPTGEIDPHATRKTRLNISSQNSAGAVVTKSADQFYKVRLGAQSITMKSGDSLKQFQVERPTIAQQNFWDTLLDDICNSYNFPKLLLRAYSLQGTVTRADLDICATAFRFYFERIADALSRIYVWQTTWALKFDRSLDGAIPENALSHKIDPPRAPNVDIGYTAQALQLELQMGTKTYQQVCGERQIDWRHQMEDAAQVAFYKKKLSKKYSSLEEGIEVLPDEISQIAKQPLIQPEPEPDGDEPAKPQKEAA